MNHGIRDWFRFETREQRKRREQAYFRKMFPLGKEEQEWERNTLGELFPKKDVPYANYLLLTLREYLYATKLDEDDEDYICDVQTALDLWRKDRTYSTFRQEQVNLIEKIAFLENMAGSLDELPALEDIRRQE